MNLDMLICVVSTASIIVVGMVSLFGYANVTLAILVIGAYIGSNIWLGLNKIAKTINEKM